MLDLVTAFSLDRWDLLGLELHWLESVASGVTSPVLLICATPGRTVSVGRYHLYGGVEERGGIVATRRLTGGRVTGAGEGWLQLVLILPHRTALLPERDTHLRPEQSMNRYARGVLFGLRGLGLDGFYPGRDAITLTQREIAMCSMETGASGSMLFETLIAVNRGMEEVVHDLERFDPVGALACPLYGPDHATKLVRELDRDVSLDELATALSRGHGELLGETRIRELTADELAHAAHRGRALKDSGWLARTADPDQFNRVARITSQLGAVELRLAVSSGDRVERAMISGDVIANSAGIATFERELAVRRLELAAVSQAVMRAYGDGQNYVLGLGDLANLPKLVMRAQ